ncbi:GGDEF domain-containing protein [Rhodobacteraceae bacterium D3-12]|nr:GGDEF domain-containing protein [Rhodobacteraceae bacterium D3-12]
MQSLAQLLKISLPEIRSRKQLLGIAKEQESVLLANRYKAAASVDQIVDRFYELELRNSGIRAIIGDADTLKRLRRAMRGYVLELFGGNYGVDYVNSRLRIGKVHARIGVDPKFYVSSMVQLEELIYREVGGPDGEPALKQALHRLFMFDLQFVFDTYVQGLVQEVHFARNDLVTYAESLELLVDERTREINRLANIDDLTGLSNRRTLFSRLDALLETAEREDKRLALIFLDLDGFKQINDRDGHVAGDAVLGEVGEVIRDTAGAEDEAFRYGGDEFCILMPDASPQRAFELSSRLSKRIEERLQGRIGISIGIAGAGTEIYPDADALIQQADAAMYSHKHDGIARLEAEQAAG